MIKYPIILFDPGHGKDTKGKCSPDAMDGKIYSPLYFKEWKWCREVAASCCDVLQAEGYTAFLLVKEESDVSLEERTKRVNAYCNRYGKANVLVVSVHNNAAGKGDKWMDARGWSIYTTKGVTESDYLAKEIFSVAEQEFKAPLNIRRYSYEELGADFEEQFYILRNTQCPAVLVEHFFQDNKEDVLYLNSDAGKGSCIHVLTQGVENYIKVSGKWK